MKRILSILAAAILSMQLHAHEPNYTPGLGDFMGMIQIRHAKLWYAGENQNWKLAAYELDELSEGFEDVATYHSVFKGKPIADLIKTYPTPAIAQIRYAIDKKDLSQFSASFDKLTHACVKCHENTGYGFIRIERPSTPPFTNQQFKL